MREKTLDESYVTHRKDARERYDQAMKSGSTPTFFHTTHVLTLSDTDRREYAFWSEAIKVRGKDAWVKTSVMSLPEYEARLRRVRG